jgi:hypothetical protein
VTPTCCCAATGTATPAPPSTRRSWNAYGDALDVTSIDAAVTASTTAWTSTATPRGSVATARALGLHTVT